MIAGRPQFDRVLAGLIVLFEACAAAACARGSAAEIIVIEERPASRAAFSTADSTAGEISPRILRRFAAGT